MENKVKKFSKIILRLFILLLTIAIFTGGIMLALSLIFYGKTYFNSDYKNANLVIVNGNYRSTIGGHLVCKIYFEKEK